MTLLKCGYKEKSRKENKNERIWNIDGSRTYYWNCRILQNGVWKMTIQESLAELKDRVRCAEWVDEDYVDYVSTEALKVAIEVLEREISTDTDRV